MKNPKENIITLRMNSEESEKLDELVKHWQTNKSILIRTLINKLYKDTYDEQNEETDAN